MALRGASFVCLLGLALGCSGDDPPPQGQSCETSACHGSRGETARIEQAHPKSELSCSDCHGGDPKATDKAAAHVAPGAQWLQDNDGYIKNLAVNDLDRVSSDYLRFINPGDYRVAEVGCGARSPAAGGGSCHQGQVDTAPRSVMATFTGHFAAPRHQHDMQGRDAELASVAIEALGHGEPPRGAVASLEQAFIPADDAPRDEMSTLMDHYLSKNCTHCHAWSYGKNDAAGNFRSSGCTSCHMIYSEDGLSQSADPVRQQGAPHPRTHELTTNISTQQCEHCHYQGARIGLLYQGIIEWGVEQDSGLPPLGRRLHGHDEEFYRKGGTRYPGDLHFLAGMDCMDCHQGRDVHGDGNLYSSSKFEVSVRCENCHGNIDAAVKEGSATPPLLPKGEVEASCRDVQGPDGAFLNCNGDALKGVYRRGDGSVWLRPANGGSELEVPQVHDMIASGDEPRMAAAMGRDPDTGVSHTEVIECHGCHSGFREYCFGCHVTMDYTSQKADLLTGVPTHGAEIAEREFATLDLYFIGKNERGKIASFCPSMQLFGTSVVDDGQGGKERLFESRIRRSAGGKRGFNWAVDAPHTTTRTPQPCWRCHADANDDCSVREARMTYGFGTGRYMGTDEDGVSYDLTQLLDADGVPLVNFSHEGQGAVDRGTIDRALSRCVAP